MSPLDLMDPTLVQRIGWTLLHSLWQGAAGAVLLALLLRWAGERSDLRHAAAAAVLALLVILPPMTFVLLGPAAPVAAPAEASTTAPAVEGVVVKGDAAAATLQGALTRADRGASDAGAAAPGFPLSGEAALGLLVALWMVGVAFGAVRLSNDLRAVRRLRRTSRPAAPALSRVLRRLQRKLGMERSVLLALSDAVDSPVAFGWWQPVILFPASLLSGLSPEQTRLLLAHELIHLRRGDYAVSLLQGLAETVYFYQPTVWWASRVLRTEREFLCDAAAAELCSDRLTYARTLLHLETWRSAPALVCAGGSGDLSQRVRRLVQPAPSSSWRGGRMVAPTAVLLCGLALLLAPVMSGPAGAAAVAAEATPAVVATDETTASLDAADASGGPDAPSTDRSASRAGLPPAPPASGTAEADTAKAGTGEAGTGKTGTAETSAPAVSGTPEGVRPAPGDIGAIATGGEPLTVDDLLEGLRFGDEETRELSAWLLGRRSEGRAVVPLLEALADAEAEVRAQAAWALGRTGDARADLALLQLVATDPRADVRDKAAWSLARSANPAVAPALTAVLRDDSSAEVRRRAAWALGHQPGDATVSALAEALDDPSAEVRHRAAWSLGRVGDPAAIPALLAALKDTSAPVRSWSAWALGHVGDETVIPALRDLVDDPSADVRRRADWAAGAIRQRTDLARGILPRDSRPRGS